MPGSLAPGFVLDGFTLRERLHQGGQAVLWRVTHPQYGYPLLMKIPLLWAGENPAAIVGFEVEQMILPRLTGVHVPKFVAAGETDRHLYLVMEHIPGPSLRERLDDAPLDAAEVARIGARVAAALHELHRQQVVHLDLKPSNILFRESGEAVLVDFGLARHERLPDLLAEEFHLPMGTGPYISPEQVMYLRGDPRSDVFALGVILYYLATGERPFGNPSSVRALRRRLYRDPVPPRARVPAMPSWLQEVILKCLEVEAAKRYASAALVAFDLQHPREVRLSERAQRLRRDSLAKVARRWTQYLGAQPDPRESESPRAPIIMAAIDLSEGMEEFAEAIREAVGDILRNEKHARLACVSVIKTSRIAIDEKHDSEGRNLHVKRLIELKHWARPLGIEKDRVSYHVLEAPDAATAIIDYSRANKVEHIILGARGSSAFRRYLGSVSSKIVAEALCTVTVVRASGEAGGDSEHKSD